MGKCGKYMEIIPSYFIHVLQKYHCPKCGFSCSQKKKQYFLASDVPSVTHMSVLYEILHVTMNFCLLYVLKVISSGKLCKKTDIKYSKGYILPGEHEHFMMY